LFPGEFAVAFLPKAVNLLPATVYDFSVRGGKPGSSNPYDAIPTNTTGSK